MAKLAGNTAAAGNILSIGGTIGGLVSGYYAAEAEKYKLRSNALNAEHQRDMAKINASIFRMQAQQVARAYDRQIMIKTMAAGNKLSSSKASMAARGGQMGYGSAANAYASARIMGEVDKLTMNSNKVKAVNDMRMRGVNADIRGDMAQVSANNMFSSAAQVSPFLNMAGSLLTGAADIAKNWQ